MNTFKFYHAGVLLRVNYQKNNSSTIITTKKIIVIIYRLLYLWIIIINNNETTIIFTNEINNYKCLHELTILKGIHITKKLCVFEVFEKTSWLSKLPHSYFLYVGVPRWVTKLFRIEEENMPVAEIKADRNSFTKIPPNPKL